MTDQNQQHEGAWTPPDAKWSDYYHRLAAKGRASLCRIVWTSANTRSDGLVPLANIQNGLACDQHRYDRALGRTINADCDECETPICNEEFFDLQRDGLLKLIAKETYDMFDEIWQIRLPDGQMSGLAAVPEQE